MNALANVVTSCEAETRTAPLPARNDAPCGRISGWAVVYTHPQAERYATAQIALRGYEVYLPLTPSRAALFPRYAFVWLRGDPWTTVRYAPGVVSLLMEDGKPGIVPRASVEAVRGVEAEAATRQRTGPQMAPGDAVVVRTGPMAGANAVVLEAKARTARIALVLMGGLRTVSVSRAALAERTA